jgi:hypothetical protein
VRLKPLGHLSGVERNLLTLAEIHSIRMAMPRGFLRAEPKENQNSRRNRILRVADSQVD